MLYNKLNNLYENRIHETNTLTNDFAIRQHCFISYDILFASVEILKFVNMKRNDKIQ